MAGRVTLRDIGKVAGVHHTTVSLALRNHPSLPEQTKLRIRQIAEEMGYRPDPALAALNAHKTSRARGIATAKLAMVVNIPEIEDEDYRPDFFRRTLQGAQARALTHGYEIDIFNMAKESLSSARLETVLSTRSISGVILTYFRDTTDIAFDWSKFSAVKIEHLPENTKLNVVCSNQMHATELALTKLKERGYKRPAAILNTLTDLKLGHYYSAGFGGFIDLFEEEDRLHPLYFDDVEDLKRKLPQFLEATKPDSIVSDYNHVVAELCEGIGYRVPEELGIASLSLPGGSTRFSGVLPAYERVGELAVDVVAQMLRVNERGIPEHCFHTLVDGSWSEGDSLPSRRAT